MPGVETAQLVATCGDLQTGSTKVFANGLGISRVDLDLAIGTILGPGSQTVFVENFKASLPGDIILPHGSPLPPFLHGGALTNPLGSPTVFAGTGFSIGGAGGGVVAAPDLKTILFTVVPTSLTADFPPAAPIFSTLTPVVFTYTIKNEGDGAAGAFTIGLWKTPGLNDDPTMLNPAGPWLLTRVAADLVGAKLIDSIVIPGLGVGMTTTGSFTHIADPEWSNLLFPTWFAVFPDIDDVIGESDEANMVTSIEITVT